jgi:hypothetical protein
MNFLVPGFSDLDDISILNQELVIFMFRFGQIFVFKAKNLLFPSQPNISFTGQFGEPTGHGNGLGHRRRFVGIKWVNGR